MEIPRLPPGDAVSNLSMREHCPDPELFAAHVDGALPEAEGEPLLDHAAECDDCRRELALTVLRRGHDEPVPAALRQRILGAVLGTMGRRATARLPVACPDVHVIAELADGTLHAEEAQRLLDHAGDCELCRREVAIVQLRRGRVTPLPRALRDQILQAVFAAIERGATTRISPACPDAATIAAYAEGHLEESEGERLLDHAAVCDECRRELAIVHLRRDAEATPAPAPMQARLRQSVVGTRRIHFFRPRRRSYLAPLATAAAVVLAVGIAIAIVRSRPEEKPVARKDEPRREQPPERAPEPAPPKREAPPEVEPSRIEWPPVLPEEKPVEPPVITQKPIHPPRKIDTDKPAPEKPAPDPIVDRKTPPGTTTVRKLDPITLTDLSGDVFVKRKDRRDKEKVNGATVVGDGDVLIAEKISAFFLLNNFPIALMPKTTVSVAFEKETHAPSLTLESGEALIDSSAGGGSRWLLTSGSVALTVNKTRAKFSAAIEEKTLSVTAISGSLSGEDGSGRTFSIRDGEKLSATAASLSTKSDAAAAVRKGSTLDKARPVERTVFAMDRATQPLEGLIDREKTPKGENIFFRAAEKKGVYSLKVQPKAATYHRDLLIRLRLCTNVQEVRIGMEIEERIGLASDVKIRKEQKGRWISLDIPFEDLLCIQGGGTITQKDRITLLSATGSQREVFGDERGYILVDDLQLVERNP